MSFFYLFWNDRYKTIYLKVSHTNSTHTIFYQQQRKEVTMTQAAQSKAKTIAVFATGITRTAIAGNLKENSFNVNVWNRSYEK